MEDRAIVGNHLVPYIIQLNSLVVEAAGSPALQGANVITHNPLDPERLAPYLVEIAEQAGFEFEANERWTEIAWPPDACPALLLLMSACYGAVVEFLHSRWAAAEAAQELLMGG